MSSRFSGKTAIVTGASRGIGFAVARRLVDDGARVVITARGEDALREAAASLGENARFVAGKADDPAHQDEVIRTAIDEFGGADLLVNNTGINPAYGPLLGLDLGTARKILEVNVVAAVAWVQKVHAAWMGEHGGAIVNVASVAAIQPAPMIAMYGVSKAALKHLTEELAFELAPTIRVNAVAPAVLKTSFARALYEVREDEDSKA
jgi:NAD(P)-dependent dehydrogenase (short-subunit alcohol dehydrogenase family)